MKITKKKLNNAADGFFKAARTLKEQKFEKRGIELYELAGLSLRKWAVSLEKKSALKLL